MACAAGASAATTAVVSTAATVGCYTVAAGVGACALSDAGEIVTGTNVIRDYVCGGDQKTYDTIKEVLSVATAGIFKMADFGRQLNTCFIAGTLVMSENGEVPIEDIEAGDLVWAWDETSGDIALKKVVETYVNESRELVHLFVNGKEIVATANHPFYCPTKGWTAACKLRAGDILVTVNGEYVVVEKVQHELLESPVKVYNFQVEDYHTYYISKTCVLVHNDCPKDYSTKNTVNKSATMESEGHARAFARQKVGSNPLYVGDNKIRSSNGVWQYRAKPVDVADFHVHLERLDPETGEVLINWHLRWK